MSGGESAGGAAGADVGDPELDHPRDGATRLGAPVELPWWVLVLGVPPAACLVLAAVLPAPASGRLLDALASAGMLWVLVRVALRVRSQSMQSVWISAAFAFWVVFVLLWAVEVHG